METKRRKFWNNMKVNDLPRNFLEGLLILVPVVTTLYVAWLVLQAVDGWLKIPVPGVGFLVTLALITLTGRYDIGYDGGSVDKSAVCETALHIDQRLD